MGFGLRYVFWTTLCPLIIGSQLSNFFYECRTLPTFIICRFKLTFKLEILKIQFVLSVFVRMLMMLFAAALKL